MTEQTKQPDVKIIDASETKIDLLIYGHITLELQYNGKELREVGRTTFNGGGTYIFGPQWKKALSMAYAALRQRQREAKHRKREPVFL